MKKILNGLLIVLLVANISFAARESALTVKTTLSDDDLVRIVEATSNESKSTSVLTLSNYFEGTISERVFAYMATPNVTTMTLPDRWYILQSVFTNTILEQFTADETGITYIGSGGKFESEYMTGGYANKIAIIRIAIVKNGVFTGTLLDVGQSILQGSGGLDECSTLAGASGFGNPRGLWAGTLSENDKITIVIRSSEANTVWTPDGGSASIHRFL